MIAYVSVQIWTPQGIDCCLYFRLCRRDVCREVLYRAMGAERGRVYEALLVRGSREVLQSRQELPYGKTRQSTSIGPISLKVCLIFLVIENMRICHHNIRSTFLILFWSWITGSNLTNFELRFFLVYNLRITIFF